MAWVGLAPLAACAQRPPEVQSGPLTSGLPAPWVWTRMIPDTGTSYVSDVVADADGLTVVGWLPANARAKYGDAPRSIVIGADTLTQQTTSSGFVARYSVDGTPQWARRLGEVDGSASGIARGPDGALYVVGSNDPSGDRAGWASRLDASGAVVWTRTLPSVTTVHGVTVDGQGTIWVAAETGVLHPSPDIRREGEAIAVAVSPDGDLLATHRLGPGAAYSVAPLVDGVCVAGQVRRDSGLVRREGFFDQPARRIRRGFISRLALDGVRWTHTVRADTIPGDRPYASFTPSVRFSSATATDGGCVASGWFQGQLDTGTAAVFSTKPYGSTSPLAVAVSASGARQWVTRFDGASSNGGNFANAIGPRPGGGFVVAGSFIDSLRVGPYTLTTPRDGGMSSRAVYVAELGEGGAVLRAVQNHPRYGRMHVDGIDVAPSGRIAVVGGGGSAVRYGTRLLSGRGNQAYVLALDLPLTGDL